jgi:hypothetical protein
MHMADKANAGPIDGAEAPDEAELDRLQNAYQAAVEAWVDAIRSEARLASVHHTLAEIDRWEDAHFLAEERRRRAEAAKSSYERALRSRFFDFG